VIGATLQSEQELPSGSSFGGLHGGYARLSGGAVALHDLTFVPGVALSGTLSAGAGKFHSLTVRIGGSAAAHGTVTFVSGRHAFGVLGGRRFDVSTAGAKLARAGAGAGAAPFEWPAWRPRFPLPALARLR
jgi:hypothetical protein